MRVALIGPVPPQLGGATPGGVATHQVHLAAGLAAAGIDAPLLATNASSPAAEWKAPAADAPFPLYRMARPAWANSRYGSTVGIDRAARYALKLTVDRPHGSRRDILEQLLWYRHFIATMRADLVHVQHPLERCLYARTVRRFEGWKMPLVVTAHSLSGEHAAEVIESLMAPNLRAADRVIAVSPHIARETIELGVESKRVRTIRSGVDVEHFFVREGRTAREALGIDVDTPLVLFVGNLEPRKQVDVLLRAMAQICAVLPEAMLIVIGSGESAGVQDQTARLVRLTRDLELGEAVHFVGRVDDEQLLDWYAAADVFALASSSEAQGIVALEAMACGLPVVATAVGGLVGTIEDGETGYLVRSGDATALAERVLALLQDAALRETIGAAARRAVERDFSWSQAVKATLEVYGEALEHA